MNILISNDDGIDSPGIHCLAEHLKDIGHVTVVAPHRERSTAGHSLTLHKPLRCTEVKTNFFAVTGTPADCIYMALKKILKSKPDIIVSGINRGANLGNDVYYSGTVAAAREGAYCGIKALALSLVIDHSKDDKSVHFETAAAFAKSFVPQMMSHKFSRDHVINVNVPNVPAAQVKGSKLSKLGERHYQDIVTLGLDPRGRPYYWVGGNYQGFENIPGSDCVHVDQGYISITPLKIDSTDYELMEEFKRWELPFASH